MGVSRVRRAPRAAKKKSFFESKIAALVFFSSRLFSLFGFAGRLDPAGPWKKSDVPNLKTEKKPPEKEKEKENAPGW
jgi:hypothetical protein